MTMPDLLPDVRAKHITGELYRCALCGGFVSGERICLDCGIGKCARCGIDFVYDYCTGCVDSRGYYTVP